MDESIYNEAKRLKDIIEDRRVKIKKFEDISKITLFYSNNTIIMTLDDEDIEDVMKYLKDKYLIQIVDLINEFEKL